MENFEEKNDIVFGEEYDTQQEFSLIDDGTYEVAIDKIEKRISKNGNKCLNFTFVIRKDVVQEFQGRKLFYSITQKNDDARGLYDFNRINKLITTQKTSPNYKTHFGTADEVFQYLQGIHLTLEVQTQYDDFTGKDRNIISDFSFAPSEWDSKEKVLNNNNDDLPF